MITFRDAYCQRTGCRPEDFEREILLACMSGPSAFCAKIIMRYRPDFFGYEYGRLRQAGNVTDQRHVYDFAAEFSDPRRGSDAVRDWLGIRPRGRTLIAISLDVMVGPDAAAQAAGATAGPDDLD